MKCNYNKKKMADRFDCAENYLRAMKKLNENSKPDFHYNRDFERLFLSLSQKCGKAKLWKDFITVSACKISNYTDDRFRDQRKKMRADILSGYTEDEIAVFDDMLAIVNKALGENREQNFLGDMYTMLDPYGTRASEYYATYEKCACGVRERLKSGLTLLHNGEPLTSSFRCCATGTGMIALANEALNAGVNYQSQILFIGHEEIFVEALTCYIQMSLIGCRAIIKIADGDRHPFVDEDLKTAKVWLTPMYTHGDQIVDYFARKQQETENNDNTEKGV